MKQLDIKQHWYQLPSRSILAKVAFSLPFLEPQHQKFIYKSSLWSSNLSSAQF